MQKLCIFALAGLLTGTAKPPYLQKCSISAPPVLLVMHICSISALPGLLALHIYTMFALFGLMTMQKYTVSAFPDSSPCKIAVSTLPCLLTLQKRGISELSSFIPMQICNYAHPV